MWPFRRRKSAADVALEWWPRAVEVASEKWTAFQKLPFKNDTLLVDQIATFVVPFEQGIRQWAAFKNAPSSAILLIVAQGIEKSRTHLRIEIESALGVQIPKPHERSNAHESQILMKRLVDTASEKWRYFDSEMKFENVIGIVRRLEIFEMGFVEGAKVRFPMFRDADDVFFREIVVLGIIASRTLTPSETDILYDLVT